jgi:hypothetical protein
MVRILNFYQGGFFMLDLLQKIQKLKELDKKLNHFENIRDRTSEKGALWATQKTMIDYPKLSVKHGWNIAS